MQQKQQYPDLWALYESSSKDCWMPQNPMKQLDSNIKSYFPRLGKALPKAAEDIIKLRSTHHDQLTDLDV